MRTIVNLHPNLKYDALVHAPKVVVVRQFSEEGYKKFDQDFNEAHKTGQTVIPVVIDSYGGECYSLMGMIGIMQSSKIPVATILLSKAMSCGIILFTCGNEGMRFMAPLATLMIHDVSSGVWGKVEDIKVDAKETERLNEIIYDIMDKNCGRRKGYFKDLVHEKGHADWYLDAKESVKHNLANHIGIPTFNVNVKMEFDLSI